MSDDNYIWNKATENVKKYKKHNRISKTSPAQNSKIKGNVHQR